MDEVEIIDASEPSFDVHEYVESETQHMIVLALVVALIAIVALASVPH